MLDSWSADDINAFCTLIQSFPLTPSIGQYAIGPSAAATPTTGAFVGTRPTTVNKCTLVILTNPVQPLRQDMDLLDAEQWQNIALQSTQSTLTRKCFYNPTLTNGTLNFWPVPTEVDNIEISSMQQLAAGFTQDTQAFIAPPGYLDAVRYNLAIRLSMEWMQELKPGVVELASEALAKVQRKNLVTPQMQLDPAIFPGRGRSNFNWLSGGFGNSDT